MPNGPLVRNASARLPAAIIAFDGTQPVLRHSPPIRPFSISTTGTPERRRCRRHRQPAGAGADDAEIGGELLGHADPLDTRMVRSFGTSASSFAAICAAPTPEPAPACQTPPAPASSVGVSTCDRSKSTRQSARPAARQALYWASCAAMTLPRPGAEHGKRHRRRQNADGGGGDEGREPDAEQRRREVDQPEREGHEPQEQQIVECVGAKARGELGRERAGAPRQDFAGRRSARSER